MSEVEQRILVIFVSVVVTLIIREWFAKQREERDRAAWQISNIKPFFFDEYLTDEIKSHRKALQENEKEYFLNIDPKLDADKDKISKAVQRIGIMVYIGAIPLSYVLIMNGFQVVTDWMHISKYVDEIRGGDWRNNNKNIPYCRRHAEWLALVCYMYLRTSNYSVNNKTGGGIKAFEEHYNGYKNILLAEKLLRNGDVQFAGKANMNEVKSIRAKYWRHEFFRKINLTR